MTQSSFISGIQQIGIGCTNVDEVWKWYRQLIGYDVALFDDKAEAKFMIPYTGGEVHSRRALLALNMAGGGGLEIWQFTSRVSQPHTAEPLPGDLGIYAIRFKSPYIEKSHLWLKSKANTWVSELYDLPVGKGFWGKDPFGNTFQVAQDDSWFKSDARPVGGAFGAVLGVTNIEKSIAFYETLLGKLEVKFDQTGTFKDLPGEASKQTFRRVILHKKEEANGAFSHLLGNTQLELLQAFDRTPRKLFENRFWGDCGFIHLCFDTLNMNAMKDKLAASNYPFTVDSGESFDMDSAAGRFAYVEDPDGTLIELVETHKLPILKKIGWYLDLRKRKHQRPLPNWMLTLLGLGRVKD